MRPFNGSGIEMMNFLKHEELGVTKLLDCLDGCMQASELEVEVYPVLDELTTKISTLNLEHVRRLKSRLVALTRRVQKVSVS